MWYTGDAAQHTIWLRYVGIWCEVESVGTGSEQISHNVLRLSTRVLRLPAQRKLGYRQSCLLQGYRSREKECHWGLQQYSNAHFRGGQP